MQTPRSNRRFNAPAASSTFTPSRKAPSKTPSSYSSRKRPQPLRGHFDNGIWHCDCTPRLPAEHFKVRKAGPNQGRYFYTCQRDPAQRCNFFLWEQDAQARETKAVLANSRSEPAATSPAQTNPSVVEKQAADKPSGAIAAAQPTTGAKRSARDALLDADEDDQFAWSPTGQEVDDLAATADQAVADTPPRKTRKVSDDKANDTITPSTSFGARDKPRRLPWLSEDPDKSPPKTTSSSRTKKSLSEYFQPQAQTPAPPPPQLDKPSSPLANDNPPPTPPSPTPATLLPTTPHTTSAQPLALPPSPPLTTPSQTLTAALTTLLKPHPSLPDPLLADLYALARTHDLRAQGVLQGRAIARRALQERDKRIEVLERELRELREERD